MRCYYNQGIAYFSIYRRISFACTESYATNKRLSLGGGTRLVRRKHEE